MKPFRTILDESRQQHKDEAHRYLMKAAGHNEDSFEYHDAMAKHHNHMSHSSIRSDEHSEKSKAHRAKADALA